MRLTGVLITLAVALLAQAVLARFTVGSRATVDLVLIGVVYAGLRWGPVAGMLAGTLGGLALDMMAGEIVGVGGLAKTLVGFGAGVTGAQFVLVRAQARTVIVAVATLLQRLIMLGLYAVIAPPGWSGAPWTAILIQIALTAACAFVAFQAADLAPGVVERRRAGKRATLSRRRW